MRGPAATLTLDPDPRGVREARQHVRGVLRGAGLEDLVDRATLAVSELVTNAFVHAGTAVQVRVYADGDCVRVEVEDRARQLPSMRSYADASGTGRGLHILEESVHRWGTAQLSGGKVVWFELGEGPDEVPADSTEERVPSEARSVTVTLRHVPLLLHLAWQEHAAALLREYLLLSLEDVDGILDLHAQASDAMSLLYAQIPLPQVSRDSAEVMATAVEPAVTADEVSLQVPVGSVAHFTTLDELLRAALEAARAGRFLSAPPQPELQEVHQWLCDEVVRQARSHTPATPWHPHGEARAGWSWSALDSGEHPLWWADEAVLVTDQSGVIVGASPEALRLLGHQEVDDLVGFRVLVVVPLRYQQAHVAGLSLHATNGRDVLLGMPVEVPLVRADGTELAATMTVTAQVLPGGRHAFVARFHP